MGKKVCHDTPDNNRIGACDPALHQNDAHEAELSQTVELRKRSEYDWTGVEQVEAPMGGIHVLELMKRGMHLRDWEGKRRFELQAFELPGRIRSFLRMRSNAPTVTAAGEVKSATLYLMGSALALTAAVFMML